MDMQIWIWNMDMQILLLFTSNNRVELSLDEIE